MRHPTITGVFLLALPLLVAPPCVAQVQTEIPPLVAGAKPVTVQHVKVHGTSLEGNLEGDAVDRDIIVYLPPSYQKEKLRRYPVVYALHGYSIGAEQWTHEIHVPQTIEGAFARGAQEMIVVLPDSKTIHNGSMYSSSVTTGDFERFIAHDVVAYIDAHYRTIADRNSRGLVGHSMGGYGATRIGMKHSEVFGSLYIMSPCCLSARGARPSSPANDSALAAIKTPEQSATLPFGLRAQLATAAAWSPNPNKPPLYLDLPIGDSSTRSNVLARWAANAPLAFVDQYIGNLRQYRAIAIDVGDQDGLRFDAGRLHDVLDNYGIANSFEIYRGTHTSAVADRFQNHVLPFFSQHLCRSKRCAVSTAAPPPARTWLADNGNGTFSNPLFYDEFSDPDLVRVGDDFYLTGTTMHSMPGQPVLHSRDLVNWTLESYALDKLDLGPEYRLENGGQIYGRGLWAPSFRFHDGTFFIFSNVNGKTTQLFRARSAKGPWTRTPMKRSLHDLSVLFDDDGKVFVVWGYQDIRFAQLDSTLTDLVPGTERIIIPRAAGMGEGLHFYKINGKYFITSAWFAQRMRMPAARADRPEGPYEVNQAISIDEDFGLMKGYRLRPDTTTPLQLSPPDPKARGQISLHQGGIVETPTGEWWGFSMMDYNSVGRLTALSPITWQDGWPYFGLPGNLGRTPRIWVKPHTGAKSPPTAPYVRNDDFSRPFLANVWQWNHVPVDSMWSLEERAGFLRLHSLPAADLWTARNTLTQRAIGPRSSPTAVLETAGMQPGDVAGLALFNWPYAWIGVQRDSAGWSLEQYDRNTRRTTRRALTAKRVWLRASCDFLTEKARFSYSTDGKTYLPFGAEFTMVFQLKTFQGVRYSLFNYNVLGRRGGYADFDAVVVDQPNPRGITRDIPLGKTIVIKTAVGARPLTVGGSSTFEVVDRQLGRIALRTPDGYLSVDTAGPSRITLKPGTPTDNETFQWIETPYGDLALLSLVTHRYLKLNPTTGAVSADQPGPEPGRADGAQFSWAARR